ncbi:hypothetical protein VB735_17640 [Halotia wernerae UHCC 0503]|nr:hypothetical protein [Halotia wernerae UHCC 0503]
MDNLESKILEILNRGIPLRAVKIAEMLGVERREVNHYLYSSLKNRVVQNDEKIKIIENAFRQDKFAQLEDEQINALQSILEEAKREVNITNTAYTQGKLSFWKNNTVAIAVVSIALALGTFFMISQLRFNSTYQPTPNIPQNR